MLCAVEQFGQGVFVGPIAINADDDGFRSVSLYLFDAFDGRGGYSSAIGWNGNYGNIVAGECNVAEVSLAVCEVDVYGVVI